MVSRKMNKIYLKLVRLLVYSNEKSSKLFFDRFSCFIHSSSHWWEKMWSLS